MIAVTNSDTADSSDKRAVKILLVDDKEKNLISLEALLREDTTNVHYILCQSGEEALKIAIKEEIALMLLDVQMPGMNGYDVARFLKENSKTKDIPIIFVTAIDQEINHVLEGFNVGAVDYLFKPLNPSITKAKVKIFINLYLNKKELEHKNHQLEENQTLLQKALGEKQQSEQALQLANTELASTHQALVKLNMELEERVKHRTAELQVNQKELRKKNDQLLRINADLDNFVYTASHDLKAPISNIEGLVETLKIDFPMQNDDVTNLFEMIEHSILRFKNTIYDLANVARVQNADLTDVITIDVKTAVEEVKEDIQALIDVNHARITLNLQVANLIFSRKNFRSILYNIISNAIKYRSPERSPEITISTFKSENYTGLSISDNGLGIREQDISKIFEMFKRLHDHVEGTGMGLHIVKRVMDNADGKIEVSSEVDKGTTFTFLFKSN